MAKYAFQMCMNDCVVALLCLGYIADLIGYSLYKSRHYYSMLHS